MTKTALVITGHIRQNYLSNIQSVIGSLQNVDIDIYTTTWNKTDDNVDVSDAFIFQLQPQQIQTLDIDEYNKTKQVFKLDYDRDHSIDYILSLHKHEIFAQFLDVSKKEERGTHCGFGPEAIEYWVNRIKDQYFLIHKALDIIPNIDQYDLVLRTRTDFRSSTSINIDYNLKKTNTISLIKGYDCFEYGNPAVMTKYFNLYNHIDNYTDDIARLNRYGYDTFSAENMLRHYMKTVEPFKCNIHEDNMVEGQDFILGR